MKVRECMCNNVTWVKPTDSVCNCAKLMSNNHIGCIPVCDDSQNVVGIVTDRDIILRGVACDKDAKNTPISEIMTCKVCSCTPDTHVKEAENMMKENQIRRIPVMENNKIVGILTLGDLAANPDVNNSEVTNTLEDICNCNKKYAE